MAPPLSTGNFGYSICLEFREITKEIEKERNEQFSKKPLYQRVAYYACTIFAASALIASGGFLCFAAVEFSLGYVGYAAVSAAAMVVLTYLRERVNVYTDLELKSKERFFNPLGLDKNQNSIPDAAALRYHRSYFEKLVASPQNEKEKAEQDREWKTATTLFDKKMDQTDLKAKASTLVVLSLLLEAIQHVYHKEEGLSKNLAKRAEELLPQSSFTNRAEIKKFIEKLKTSPQELKEKLLLLVTKGKDPLSDVPGAKDKPRFRLSDLDKLIKEC